MHAVKKDEEFFRRAYLHLPLGHELVPLHCRPMSSDRRLILPTYNPYPIFREKARPSKLLERGRLHGGHKKRRGGKELSLVEGVPAALPSYSRRMRLHPTTRKS